MNSDDILAVIDAVAATSSKNEKLALLQAHAHDGDLKRIIEYAYNPFKTYGLRQIPEYIGFPDGEFGFTAATWELLDGLICRSITGNNARDQLLRQFESLDTAGRELLVRIIRKDMRAGFSESTSNKVWKKLIPEFPYMRCSLPKHVDVNDFDWAAGVISQEKADGMFANVDHVAGGEVRISSRQGTLYPNEPFAELIEEVRTGVAVDTQSHGELLVERDGVILDREIGNGIFNSVAEGGSFGPGERPIYLMWDQIPLASVVPKGKCLAPYRARLLNIVRGLKSRLHADSKAAAVQLIPTRIVHSFAEAVKHFREVAAKGKEGTIFKDQEMPWADGTSKWQIKLKIEFPVDLEATEIVPGRVGTRNEGRAGSIRMSSSCGDLVVDVTVKNEAMRNAIDKSPDDFLGRIYEVVANDITEPSDSNPKHSLFLPRLVSPGYRTDKTKADDLQQVRDQLASAIKG